MAQKKTADLRPIQVFLDTSRFIELEDNPPRGGQKDFFKDDDAGFGRHKARIEEKVKNVAAALRRRKQEGGFIKVRQRQDALAKSHRPLGSLFTGPHQFALVGAEDAGELLIQATPGALDRLQQSIHDRAEATPKLMPNKITGELEPRVSAYRSEVGGIEDIQLYDATDKIDFSAAEAVRWMREPDVIGGYIVELFRPNRLIARQAVDVLIREFRDALARFKGGLLVRPMLPSVPTAHYGDPHLVLSVQLLSDSSRLIELPFLQDGRVSEMSEMGLPQALRSVEGDLTVQRHEELLALLVEQTLVRRVELPPALETSPASAGANLGAFDLPGPVAGVDYPTVGIIDGGTATGHQLDAWRVGDAGVVLPADRDEDHGTFIAGLVCGAYALNPALAEVLESAGCKFFDLDLFPRRDLRGTYYHDLEDLFDTLDEKVKVAKRDFRVRVFNLSFAIGRRASRLAYSVTADRLDRIARANDVIFVVAAGNLRAASRLPWPKKAEDAIAALAAFGGSDEITAPGDHLLGYTIGAVNPPGVSGHEPYLPTTYTLRGPGVGGAPKPELVAPGGAETRETGLVSLTTTGEAVHRCGTSFASPQPAATLATLDQRLNRQATRETLLALPVHRATRPESLNAKRLRGIATQFVGFGIAPSADKLLCDDPHSVTLVFSERLLAKQRLEFQFSWPKSLVSEDGACRGRADITLAFTPPIDAGHRSEAIRVQLDALLHQEKLDEKTGELVWESRLDPDGKSAVKPASASEANLLKAGLKWAPIKRYECSMPKGRGNTSNWKLSLEGLARAGAGFPTDGVAFTIVMTLSDLGGEKAIREELRQDIQSKGLMLADITVAHRVRTRQN